MINIKDQTLAITTGHFPESSNEAETVGEELNIEKERHRLEALKAEYTSIYLEFKPGEWFQEHYDDPDIIEKVSTLQLVVLGFNTLRKLTYGAEKKDVENGIPDEYIKSIDEVERAMTNATNKIDIRKLTKEQEDDFKRIKNLESGEPFLKGLSEDQLNEFPGLEYKLLKIHEAQARIMVILEFYGINTLLGPEPHMGDTNKPHVIPLEFRTVEEFMNFMKGIDIITHNYKGPATTIKGYNQLSEKKQKKRRSTVGIQQESTENDEDIDNTYQKYQGVITTQTLILRHKLVHEIAGNVEYMDPQEIESLAREALVEGFLETFGSLDKEIYGEVKVFLAINLNSLDIAHISPSKLKGIIINFMQNTKRSFESLLLNQIKAEIKALHSPTEEEIQRVKERVTRRFISIAEEKIFSLIISSTHDAIVVTARDTAAGFTEEYLRDGVTGYGDEEINTALGSTGKVMKEYEDDPSILSIKKENRLDRRGALIEFKIRKEHKKAA